MINLRYHIVSLTAVFLAVGIGLTLGSTFLDRATVDNLNAQLQGLETRLEDRETEIGDLQGRLEGAGDLQAALDEQAVGLLAERITSVPVVVTAARGVDEADLRGAVQSLVVAGADVQGLWWFTDRFALDDPGEVDDLGAVLGSTSGDPARLRRMAIDELSGELRARQLLGSEAPADAPGETSGGLPAGTPDATEGAVPVDRADGGEPADPSAAPGDATGPGPVEILDALVETGFIEFEAVPGGPDTPRFPDGTRMLVVGGSTDVPDDLVIEPLVERMVRSTDTPFLGVVGSAMVDDGDISEVVSFIRQDDRLRALVPTVDGIEHFDGWAAMVLALDDVAEGIVGHYGLAEGASRLLPPLRAP
jgi:hypothetical protein